MVDTPKAADAKVGSGNIQITRTFEQGPNVPSFYSDVAQVVSTGSEVILQFYETIPHPPGSSGRIEAARSQLRATVVLSPNHARRLGTVLLEKLGVRVVPQEKSQEGGTSQ